MQTRLLVVVLALAAVVAGIFLARQAFWQGSPDQVQTSGRAEEGQDEPSQVDPAVGEQPTTPVSASSEESPGHQREAFAGDSKQEESEVSVVRLTGRLIGRDSESRPGCGLRFDVYPAGIPAASNMPPFRATSDDEGRFVLSLPRGCDGSLALDRDGHVLLSGTTRVDDVDEDRDLGDIVVLAQSRISGKVVDPRGQPVAGVKVTAAVRVFGRGPASTSTSGDDGSFSLGMLHPGEWHVRTASGQHLPLKLTLQLGPEEQLSDLELTVEAGRWISGYVVDDRGQPVAGAKVGSLRQEELSGMQINRFTLDEAVLTDESGRFSLAGLKGDRVAVRAIGDGYVTDTQNGVAVGTSNLQLRLVRQGEVVGILRDRAGQPIAGSKVTARPAEEMRRLDEVGGFHFDRLPIGPMQDAAVTAEDGSFRIANVEPGSVTVRATGDTHRPARLAGQVVAPGQVLEGVVVVADRGGVARVLVVNEAGEPVAAADVTVERVQPEPTGFGQIFVSATDSSEAMGLSHLEVGEGRTNNEGVVEIGGLPGGPARLVCRHAEYAEAVPVDLVVPVTGVADARLVVRQPGFVDVQVFDAEGQPMSGRFVVHGPVGNGEEGRDRRHRAGSDGMAHVGPLPPGAYSVELLLPQEQHIGDLGSIPPWPGARGPVVESTRQEFQVAAGKTNQVQLNMPPLVRVHGVVRQSGGAASGIQVRLVESSSDSSTEEATAFGKAAKSATTNANGEYWLPAVVPGDYELRWGKPNQLVMDRQKLTLRPGDREVQRDLRLSYGSLRVCVVDAEGEPIAGAEVELSNGSSNGGRESRSLSVSLVMTTDGSEESASVLSGAKRAKTNAQGVALVEDVPPGTYQVQLSAQRFIDGEVADQLVVEGGVTECGTVALKQSGRIRGDIVDNNGDSIPLALVLAFKVGGDGAPKPQPALGGTYMLDSLEPGKYRLSASRLGNGGRGAQGPEIEVEVVGGETATQRLTVPDQ